MDTKPRKAQRSGSAVTARPAGAQPGSHGKHRRGEHIPVSGRGRGRQPSDILKHLQALCSSATSALRGAKFPRAFIGLCQSLTDLGKENTQLCQLQPKKGEKRLRNSCGIHSANTQVHRDSGARPEKCGMLQGLLPTAHHHVTIGLCTAVPFPLFLLGPATKKKITRYPKRQKSQCEEQGKHRTSRSRDVGIIRLGIKTSQTSMLRALMDRGAGTRGQTDNVSRDGNRRKEPQRDARDKKRCNGNEE